MNAGVKPGVSPEVKNDSDYRMKSSAYKFLCFYACLVITGMFGVASGAEKDPEEKMLWKGTLSMESIEQHNFEIQISNQNGTRSHFRHTLSAPCTSTEKNIFAIFSGDKTISL